MGTKNYANATDLITFSRASGGTYLDSDGILKTAATNIPRIEYAADGTAKGLLVEEQRTNLVTYSSEFDNAAWQTNVGACTVVSNAVVAPDGSLTADELTFVGTNANRYATVSGLTTGTSYTFSVWLRVASGSATMSFGNIDGTIQSITVTDSWQRFSVTQNASGTTRFPLIRGTDLTAYAWGAQLEEGSFATSYISTSGATATRAADIASIDTADFGYNPDAGTVVVEAVNYDGANLDPKIFALSDGTGNNRIELDINDGNKLRMRVFDAGVAQVNEQTAFTDSDITFKSSLSYQEDDFVAYLNGDEGLVDSSGTIPLVDILSIGCGSSGGNSLNGHIKSIKYYPRRLTDEQLQELTS